MLSFMESLMICAAVSNKLNEPGAQQTAQCVCFSALLAQRAPDVLCHPAAMHVPLLQWVVLAVHSHLELWGW